MMMCRAIPYTGQEPYIFLSYCHKDADRVYPLLEQLVRDGYRVWYDDGNHPGDNWLENIAQHMSDSHVCLAMISENSAASHNCRNEINFAIECNKKLMAVLVEDFVMPLGMRLQLGTIHYLKKQDYPSDHMLLQKLYETEELEACREKSGSLPMRDIPTEPSVLPQAPQKTEVADFVNQEKRAGIKTSIVPLPEEEAGIAEEKNPAETAKTAPPQEPAQIQEDAPAPVVQEIQQPDEQDEKTIYSAALDEPEDEEARTIRAEQHQPMLLLRLSGGQGYVLNSAQTQIGRSKKCDVILADNPYIGSHHADIIQYRARCYLRDMGSINGSFVGEEQLPAEGQVQLENRSVFRLYDEVFLFFCGLEAQQLAKEKCVYLIRNPKTQGLKLLQNETLPLDRSHKWEDGTMSDLQISRQPHAAVSQRENGLYLEDKGNQNGVYLNGRRLSANETCQLASGDQIRIGQTVLEVGIVTL